MLVFAVDLGTTNLKVALYDEALCRLASATAAASYARRGNAVEFDADQVFDSVVDLIARCAQSAAIDTSLHQATIVLTGQAESFVLVDDRGAAIRPAISWLDERAELECAEIADSFGDADGFRITGQPTVTTTWSAPKLRWLATHEPESLAATAKVLMIKDFIQFRLTGELVGEVSTRAFSYLFDVQSRQYWEPMLEFCGLSVAQMPDLVEAGSVLGSLRPRVRDQLPACAGYTVNVGALDHFSSMVGTDSYRPGVLSESAGTVLSLSMLAERWAFDPDRLISFHRGARPDDIVLFNCADSGGVSLDWYKSTFYPDIPYDELDARLRERVHDEAPLFLPYLTGVNPPEYITGARGAFLDLRLGHDGIDMAYAVEEGVAHLLRNNVDYIASSIGRPKSIVSTGGGSRSRFWNQLKADVCNVEVRVPDETESTCRGAAIIGLVAAGVHSDFDELPGSSAVHTQIYTPDHTEVREERFLRFKRAINALYR